MARPRKELRFQDVFTDLSSDDLMVLIKEANKEIVRRRVEERKQKQAEDAAKLLKKVHIGSQVTYSGGTGEVVGIFRDKVQVIINDRKRSVALTKISKVE